LTIVADEGVDRLTVEVLRGEGHTVIYIAEESPSISDEEVLSRAATAEAVLLTQDKDFGDLIFRQRRLALGVLLLRIAEMTSEARAECVLKVFRDHGKELKGAFSVVSPRALRIRKIE
jgi:predicted nuclease of predicted toxin-antitoxin system